MEAFSLLKFWRNAGTEATVTDGSFNVDATIPTSDGDDDDVRNQALETDDETDDEESFFDLVFTEPGCNEKIEDKNVNINSSDNKESHNDKSLKKDGETRFNFIDSPKDVFFKGRVFPIELNSKPRSPISLLKSPPKFRVFMFGFKKSKSDKVETNGAIPKHYCQKSSPNEQSKRFTMKCKVEEGGPTIPLFTRENSLRSKLQKERYEDVSSCDSSKRFLKDGGQKYLKLIKPLYVKASKRYSEKMKYLDQYSTVSPLASPAPICSPKKQVEKHAGFPAGLRVVCKHLGKSKSASSGFGMMPSPASRRDDSLLEQNDGIQSAILHCKSSYKSSSKDSCLVLRSASDECYEKSFNPPRNSSDEQKRSSI